MITVPECSQFNAIVLRSGRFSKQRGGSHIKRVVQFVLKACSGIPGQYTKDHIPHCFHSLQEMSVWDMRQSFVEHRHHVPSHWREVIQLASLSDISEMSQTNKKGCIAMVSVAIDLLCERLEYNVEKISNAERATCVRSVFKQCFPAILEEGQPILENRLQKTITISKVILNGIFIGRPGFQCDLAKRYAIDPIASK